MWFHILVTYLNWLKKQLKLVLIDFLLVLSCSEGLKVPETSPRSTLSHDWLYAFRAGNIRHVVPQFTHIFLVVLLPQLFYSNIHFYKSKAIVSCSPNNFLSNKHLIWPIPRRRSWVARGINWLAKRRETKYCPAPMLEKYEQVILGLFLVVISVYESIWIW